MLQGNACKNMLIYYRLCYGSGSQSLASDQARLGSIQVQTMVDKVAPYRLFSKIFGSPLPFICNRRYITFAIDKIVTCTRTHARARARTHTHTHTHTHKCPCSKFHLCSQVYYNFQLVEFHESQICSSYVRDVSYGFSPITVTKFRTHCKV
jgi:hypothetical protein